MAVGQRFYVRLNVTSSGTATFSPGLLRLNVPANYQILSAADTSYTFSNRSVSWLVQSLAQTAGINDTLMISQLIYPVDQNTGQDAVINSFGSQLLVNAIQASIVINSIQFSSPVTNDSVTVSTDQDSIRIDARVTFHPLLDHNRQVKLQLPVGEGYSTQDSSLIRQLLNVQQSVYDLSWYIRAPKDASDWSVLNLLASANFNADANLTPVSTNATLAIQTITKASIVFTAAIVEPVGARDGSVSEGQQFRIRANISRAGTANIVPGSQGLISVQVDDSLFSLCSSCTDNAVQKTYTVGDTVSWWIDANTTTINKNAASPISEILSKLGATSSRSAYGQQNSVAAAEQQRLLNELSVALKQQAETTGAGSIAIRIDTTPLDENTLRPANAAVRQVLIPVTTETIAEISILGGNPADTVSAGQTFTYTRYFDFSANVTNMRAVISLPPGTGLIVSNPVQYIPDTKVITWNIRSEKTLLSAIMQRFSLTAWVTDNNSGTEIESQTVNDSILVQPYARVMLTAEISSPETAKNGLVSVGQTIEFRTKVERDLNGITGMADVTGLCQVKISRPDIFTLTPPD